MVPARTDAINVVAIPADVEPDPNDQAIAKVIDAHEAVGRQGGPAAIAVAIPPAYPGRRPRIARDPAPSRAIQVDPAPVMISRPAPRFVGNPNPAVLRVNPMPVGVGRPIG